MRHPSSEKFHRLLKEMGELHDKKQADYGRPTDPFANVRASEDFGIDGWIGALVRMNDKMRRLQTAARQSISASTNDNGNRVVTLKNEPIRDSFMDLAVYSLIGLCLLEEVEQQKPAPQVNRKMLREAEADEALRNERQAQISEHGRPWKFLH